ncbi:MAG: PRC-barrel domain-containing protein [Candidatus Bathyarchaeia archaeon]|jgi:sporulation protein YlmC with PRC-barrel domain
MKYGDMAGKEVIGKEARKLGRVCEIEFDTKGWKVTGFCLDVDQDAAVELGFSKSILGSVKVLLPSSMIDAISDRVILNENINEVKKKLKRLP